MNWFFDIAWVVWALLFFAIEGVAVFNKTHDDTLSEKFRDIFHTNTRAGRSVWAIIWCLFAGLFAMHIAGADLIFWR
jgi:hypothetical protein